MTHGNMELFPVLHVQRGLVIRHIIFLIPHSKWKRKCPTSLGDHTDLYAGDIKYKILLLRRLQENANRKELCIHFTCASVVSYNIYSNMYIWELYSFVNGLCRPGPGNIKTKLLFNKKVIKNGPLHSDEELRISRKKDKSNLVLVCSLLTPHHSSLLHHAYPDFFCLAKASCQRWPILGFLPTPLYSTLHWGDGNFQSFAGSPLCPGGVYPTAGHAYCLVNLESILLVMNSSLRV